MKMLSWAKKSALAVRDWVYPSLCAGCQRWSPTVLCVNCAVRLERADGALLRAQLASWPSVFQVWDDAFALWRYGRHGTVRQLQHQLKYRNQPWLGVALGQLLGQGYQAHLEQSGMPHPALILPMPLSRVRYLERGYNQSLMLGRGMADVLACPVVPDLLTRPRATQAQAHLSRTDRLTNVAGAFALTQPGQLAERAVILLDDVLTTGATLLAAARPLREAGVSHLTLVTLAFAD